MKRENMIDTEWSQSTKRMIAIGAVLLAIVILYVSRPVITSLILAGILAFLLNPIIKLFCRYLRFPRWLAVAVSYLLLLVAVVLVPVLMTPAVVNAAQDIDVQVLKLLDDMTVGLQQWLESIRQIQLAHGTLDLSPVVDPALEVLGGVVPQTLTPSGSQVVNSIPSAFQLATGLASTVVSTLLAAVLAGVITMIFSVYISLDLPNITHSLLFLIPMPHRTEYMILLEQVRRVWSAYLRGELLLMLIVGTMTSLGNLALGVPGALLLGIIAGLLEVLPNVGPVLAMVPAVLLALIQGSSVLPVSNLLFAVIVGVFYAMVQQIENNLIVPRVIGNAIEVHPILVMAGVIVGASVGGIFGALIASPLLATMRVLSQFVYNKMLGLPPFSEEPAGKPATGPPQVDGVEAAAVAAQLVVLAASAPAGLAGAPDQEKPPPEKSSDRQDMDTLPAADG